MQLEPLVAILLLVYLLLVAAVLTIWFALTARRGRQQASSSHTAQAPRQQTERSPTTPARAAPKVIQPSNDQFRGARAQAVIKPPPEDDAFERFIRARNEE